MLRIACAAVAIFMLALPVRAEMTLKQFRNYAAMPGGSSLLRSYMGGLRDGIVMLQDVLESQGKAEPTFCPEGDEIRKGSHFEDLVLREITNPSRDEPWPADIQMSRVVTLVLQAEYPCRTY
jgi:hypothetical protein